MNHITTQPTDPRAAMIAQALRRIYRPPPTIARKDANAEAERKQRAKEMLSACSLV